MTERFERGPDTVVKVQRPYFGTTWFLIGPNHDHGQSHAFVHPKVKEAMGDDEFGFFEGYLHGGRWQVSGERVPDQNW